MNEGTYIVIYSDDFKEDIWMQYMEILGLPYNETEVKIIVKNIIT